MKNLIVIPYAWDCNMQSGQNIEQKQSQLIYMQNIAVALLSARKNNVECEVALATNLTLDEIPQEIKQLFTENNISVINIPFDRFLFGPDYKWGLAFYKLCCLSHLVDGEWDNICYTDSDVYFQNNIDNVWIECRDSILLYDINHGLGVKNYRILCDEIKTFGNYENLPLFTHYGGEFFASNINFARMFVCSAEKVFIKMRKDGFVTTKGDEFIITIVAEELKSKIKNGSAYIGRYWTDENFRLISTNYKNNPVNILHLPAEKNTGFIMLYSKYVKRGIIPSNNIVWNLMNLNNSYLSRQARLMRRRIIVAKKRFLG